MLQIRSAFKTAGELKSAPCLDELDTIARDAIVLLEGLHPLSLYADERGQLNDYEQCESTRMLVNSALRVAHYYRRYGFLRPFSQVEEERILEVHQYGNCDAVTTRQQEVQVAQRQIQECKEAHDSLRNRVRPVTLISGLPRRTVLRGDWCKFENCKAGPAVG